MPAKWRAFVPARGAWWRLVAAASSYVLLVALALTMIAKLRVVRGADGVDFWLGRWIAVCAADVVWFGALAAACAFAERYGKLVQLATIPIALVVATAAGINAGYLSISGEQLSPAVIALGVERIGDVGRILAATFASPLLVVAIALVIAAVPVLVWRRQRPAWRESAQLRAHAAATCAAFALLVMVIAPRSQEYGVARLDETAVPRTLWGLVRGETGGPAALFAGYVPRDLVDKSAIDQLRAGERPNVVLVILESVRRDETTLAAPTAPARTPNLVALAARGLELTNARAVVPHTTKSVWSMLCGRLPLMQTAIYEASSTIDAQCMPEILDAAGWRTGFFQSAIGTFEHRPRLVRRLGFRYFIAAEHISKQITGYLASDDQTLLEPVTRWIDEQPSAPFMVTVLTSGTHHPYALPPAVDARVRAEGAPAGSDHERYHRLVENQDALLGGIVRALEQRGMLDRTIFVVLGDHGEGFGDKTVRQHATNFFEEGLHVPWVIAGPGIAPRKLAVAVSLSDLAPTLLALLGVQLTPQALAATPARSVLDAQPGRVLPFGCWHDGRCQGFVRDTTKVVHVPDTGEAFAFDLATDPSERSPRALTREQAATLDTVKSTIAAHRAARWLLRRDHVDWYPQWDCSQDRLCAPR